MNELRELNSRQSGQRAKTGTNKKDHSWHKSLVKVHKDGLAENERESVEYTLKVMSEAGGKVMQVVMKTGHQHRKNAKTIFLHFTERSQTQ